MNESRAVSATRRIFTDLFSPRSWPLEIIGALVLGNYGALFSSSLTLSRDYRATLDSIMPGDAWGIGARIVAAAILLVNAAAILSGRNFYGARGLLVMPGLIAWGVLVYSCWRGDVPFQIYRLYTLYFGAQIYVAFLLRAARRAETVAKHAETVALLRAFLTPSRKGGA